MMQTSRCLLNNLHNVSLVRRSIHTGISILHDSSVRLEDSLKTLQILGFEHIEVNHLTGNTTVHRLYNRHLHIDLVEDKRLTSMRKMLVTSKPMT